VNDQALIISARRHLGEFRNAFGQNDPRMLTFREYDHARFETRGVIEASDSNRCNGRILEVGEERGTAIGAKCAMHGASTIGRCFVESRFALGNLKRGRRNSNDRIVCGAS
jgi:hypothetical protein